MHPRYRAVNRVTINTEVHSVFRSTLLAGTAVLLAVSVSATSALATTIAYTGALETYTLPTTAI